MVISKPQVLQTRIQLHSEPDSFEAVCVRLTTGSSSCVVLLVYRTGAITTLFFRELSSVLDHLSTYTCPLILAGDLNIHVERPDDPHARTLLEMLNSYGLTCRVNFPTHDLGGARDLSRALVFSRSDSK